VTKQAYHYKILIKPFFFIRNECPQSWTTRKSIRKNKKNAQKKISKMTGESS